MVLQSIPDGFLLGLLGKLSYAQGLLGFWFGEPEDARDDASWAQSAHLLVCDFVLQEDSCRH